MPESFNTDADSNAKCDWKSDTDTIVSAVFPHSNTNSDSHGYAQCDPNSHSYGHTECYADRYSYGYGQTNAITAGSPDPSATAVIGIRISEVIGHLSTR